MSTKEQSLLAKLARKVVGLPTGGQSCCGPAVTETRTINEKTQSSTCCGGTAATVETTSAPSCCGAREGR